MTPKRQQKAATGNTKATKRHQKGKTTAAEKAIHWQQKAATGSRNSKEASKKAAERHQQRNKKVARR